MRACMFNKDVKDVTINKDNFIINQAYEIEIHSFSSIQKRVVIVTDIDDHKITCLCHDKSTIEISASDIWAGYIKIVGSIGVRYSDDFQEKNFVVEDSTRFFNEDYWNNHKGDEYMVWYMNHKGVYERFIGKFDSVSRSGELSFWTYGGGRILDFPKDPDTMVIIPLNEIIDHRFLSDAPPIDLLKER